MVGVRNGIQRGHCYLDEDRLFSKRIREGSRGGDDRVTFFFSFFFFGKRFSAWKMGRGGTRDSSSVRGSRHNLSDYGGIGVWSGRCGPRLGHVSSRVVIYMICQRHTRS